MTTTVLTFCAITAAIPASASARTLAATPGGKPQRRAAAASLSWRTGASAVTASAATPAVVPTDSISSAGRGRPVTRWPCGERHEGEVGGGHHDAGQHRRQGGKDEPAVRLQDPVADDGQPVQHDLRREHGQHPRADREHARRRPRPVRWWPSSSRDQRPRGQRHARLTGTSSSSVQVSSADEVCRVSALAPASAGPASTGTTMPVRAPPSTIA